MNYQPKSIVRPGYEVEAKVISSIWDNMEQYSLSRLKSMIQETEKINGKRFTVLRKFYNVLLEIKQEDGSLPPPNEDTEDMLRLFESLTIEQA